MKKSKKKTAGGKPAKTTNSLTKTTRRGQVELSEEELSRISGGKVVDKTSPMAGVKYED